MNDKLQYAFMTLSNHEIAFLRYELSFVNVVDPATGQMRIRFPDTPFPNVPAFLRFLADTVEKLDAEEQ